MAGINGIPCNPRVSFRQLSDASACVQEIMRERNLSCNASNFGDGWKVDCQDRYESGCSVAMGAKPSGAKSSPSIIERFLKWIGLVD